MKKFLLLIIATLLTMLVLAQTPAAYIYWQTKTNIAATGALVGNTGDSLVFFDNSGTRQSASASDFKSNAADIKGSVYNCSKCPEISSGTKAYAGNSRQQFGIYNVSTPVEKIEIMAFAGSAQTAGITMSSILVGNSPADATEISLTGIVQTSTITYMKDLAADPDAVCPILSISGLNIPAGKFIWLKTGNKALVLVEVRLYAPTTSTSTKLSNIQIDGLDLEGFNKNTTNYTVYTANNSATEAPVVSYTAEDGPNIIATTTPVGGNALYLNDTAVYSIKVTEMANTDNFTTYTIKFVKDKVGPALVSVSPANKSTVEREFSFVLTFSEDILNFGEIMFNTTNVNAICTFEDNKLLYTARLSDWGGRDTIVVEIPAHSIGDVNGNGMTDTLRYLYIFDKFAPTLTSFMPADASSYASRTGSVEVTYNENIKVSTEVADALVLIVNGESKNLVYGTDYTVSGTKITAKYGSLNWSDTVTLVVKQGVVSDMGDNIDILERTVTFNISKPLAKFPYAFPSYGGMESTDPAPGFIEVVGTSSSGKGFLRASLGSHCADFASSESGYIYSVRSNENDTIDIYLEKAGTVTAYVSSTGGRSVVMWNDKTEKADTLSYNSGCGYKISQIINSNDPVKVRLWAIISSTKSINLVKLEVTHPIQNVAGPDTTYVSKVYDKSAVVKWSTMSTEGVEGYKVYYGTSLDGVLNPNMFSSSVAVTGLATDSAEIGVGGGGGIIPLSTGAGVGNLSPKTKYFYTVAGSHKGVDVDNWGGRTSVETKAVLDSFTTKGGPVLLSTLPDIWSFEQPKLNPQGGEIVFTFDEAIQDTAVGLGICLAKKVTEEDMYDFVQSGFIGSSYYKILANATHTVGSTEVRLSWNAGLLEGESQYSIVIPVGKYLDAEGYSNVGRNKTTSQAYVLISSDVDNPQLEVVSVTYEKAGAPTALKDAADLPVDSGFVVTVTFNKTAIDKKATGNNAVAFTTGAGPTATKLPLTIDSISPTTYTVTVNKVLVNGTNYTLRIPVAAFADVDGVNLSALYSGMCSTIDIYVEDVVYYTDFATNPLGLTPMIAHWADSVVINDLPSARYSPTFSSPETFSFDGFTFVASGSGRRFDFYGYNSNSEAGQAAGLSYGRVAINNASQQLNIPIFTAPFKMMYSINAGGTGLRALSLRDGSTELRRDTVSQDAGSTVSKVCYYEELGAGEKSFNFYTSIGAGQLHDLEIIKTVKQKDVSAFYSHWVNVTKKDGLAPFATLDIRFNKRIRIADASLVTITNVAEGKTVTIDSVRAVGNALIVYFATNSFVDTMTLNVPIGSVVQETTGQVMDAPQTFVFNTRELLYAGHELTSVIVSKDTAVQEGNNFSIELDAESTAKLDSIVVKFTASEGSVVTVDGEKQVSGTTMNDFTNPLTYVVTSGDLRESTQYIVTVSKKSANQNFVVETISIYPNPTTDIINISGKDMSIINIYDMAGRVVKVQVVNNNNTSINVENLKAGNYIVNIITKQGDIRSTKIVKK
ncbi:hypothetical protein FACS1894153_2330 [Bacteroidia bacterium]|nr:hypothetical protein FACS1894153_2330 [Bacteroidia bacterium]